MVHVLHVVPTGHRNPLLLSMIDPRLADYSVFSLAGDGELADSLEDRSVPFSSAPEGTRMRHRTKALIKYIRSQAPDVVELHSLLPGAIGAMICFTRLMPARPRFIYVRHHNLYHHLLSSRKSQWLDQFVSKNVDWSVAVSGAVRDTMIAEGVNPSRIKVIENALHPNFLAAQRLRPIDRPKAGSINMLAIGRLEWVKDYPSLFKAVALVRSSGHDVQLTVLGTGHRSVIHSLERQIEDLELTETVRLQGFVPDVGPWLEETDLFAHASLDEAFGLVLLEALSAGVPIVSTGVGGTREVLARYYDTVPPGRPDSFASAIIREASQLEHRKGRAMRIAKYVPERFSWERMAARHAALCEQSLGT